MAKLNDTWARVVGIPLVAAMPPLLMSDLLGIGPIPFWEAYAIVLVEITLIWEANRYAIGLARHRYPGVNQTRRRIGFLLLRCALITFGLQALYTIFHVMTLRWHFSAEQYVANNVLGLFFLIPIAGIYEAVYLYREWRRNTAEAAVLRREQVERQLAVLKGQINPHFLFNSFNVLASLIQTDPRQATEFLDELAQVYRYLLRANRTDYSTLADELEFIRAYAHLLQTRFGAGLTLTIDIDQRWLTNQLPTLTLQLLVENAVKHNIVSVSKPLHVRLYMQRGCLVVENNLQKKKIAVASGKVGLSNIAAKYNLLGETGLTIEETDTVFRVTLPLLVTTTDRPL